MTCFPQVGQYPITRKRFIRTIQNRLGDGSSVRLADPAASKIEWELAFRDLSTDEALKLEEFYQAAEGKLRSFVFLDPCGNLLAWSEKPDEPEWQRNTLLQLTPRAKDPGNRERGWSVRNPTAAELSLRQTINAPAAYTYNFSVWVRSGAGSRVWLQLGAKVSEQKVSGVWRRLSVQGEGGTGEDDSISVGVAFEGGSSVEIFGMQVCPHMGASGYVRTDGRGAVWPNASFAHDQIEMRATGPNRYDCKIRIRHAYHF